MHAFDQAIISFCNQFAQRWPLFDSIVVFFSNSDLMKGGVLFAGLWWVWFRRGSDMKTTRAYLLSALLGSVLALTVARVLAHTLPLRARPILDPGLHFRPPVGVPDQSNWTIWSSFPSDHAALFFALLTGIWLGYSRAGILLLGYVIIGICFPRIYIGIHYPTDLLAGAVLGIGFVLLCSWKKMREYWTGYVLSWIERWPGAGYAMLFLVSFEIATLFWDIRTFLYIFDVSV
jgi:membrane-associated phospholipid phosphatase